MLIPMLLTIMVLSVVTLASMLFIAYQDARANAPALPTFGAILASFDAADGRKALMALVPMAPKSTAPRTRAYAGYALRPTLAQRARVAIRWAVACSAALRAAAVQAPQGWI